MTFLELMVAISGHPSHTISIDCLSFWNAFLSNGEVHSQVFFFFFKLTCCKAFVPDLCKQLLVSYAPKLAKVRFDDKEQALLFPFITLDFISQEV